MIACPLFIDVIKGKVAFDRDNTDYGSSLDLVIRSEF